MFTLQCPLLFQDDTSLIPVIRPFTSPCMSDDLYQDCLSHIRMLLKNPLRFHEERYGCFMGHPYLDYPTRVRLERAKKTEWEWDIQSCATSLLWSICGYGAPFYYDYGAFVAQDTLFDGVPGHIIALCEDTVTWTVHNTSPDMACWPYQTGRPLWNVSLDEEDVFRTYLLRPDIKEKAQKLFHRRITREAAYARKMACDITLGDKDFMA